MARRKATDPGLSLFPFLSVLAAVMGTLILIISGMSQLALASPKQGIEVQAFDPEKKSPVFVECRRNGVRIYKGDPTKGRYDWTHRAELRADDSDWSELLRVLRYDDSRYLMLLVRDDGVQTFNAVQRTLDGTAIETGYEPLFGTGAVNFRKRGGR